MKRLSLFLPFLFLFFISDINGQQIPGLPFQFGKVSKEDLNMTVYEPDTAAAAVVLGEFGLMTVEFFSYEILRRLEFQRRVKILKRSGFDYGNVRIPFIHYWGQEEFFFDKAIIHLPSGEKIKVKKKDIFVEKVNEFFSEARIVFPQVEVGAVIEYSYVLHAKGVFQLPDWNFQEEIPMKYSELRVNFPHFLTYKYIFQGAEGMGLVSDENGVKVFKGKKGTCRLSNRKYVMENAPAMRPEPFITTMGDYQAKIRFQMQEVFQDTLIKSWETVQKGLLESDRFGKHYLEKGNYSEVLKLLEKQLGDISDEKEIVSKIYSFVLENSEWDGTYSIMSDGGTMNEVFKKEKKTSAESNLLLLALLKEYGIEAYPVLLSTRRNGKVFEAYPFVGQFNYLIIYANYAGKELFMDATDPLRPLGFPIEAALNERGLMLLDGGAPAWVNILPPKRNKDVFYFEVVMDEDGELKGEMRGAYQGYNALKERKQYNGEESKNHWETRIEEFFPDAELTSSGFGNLDKIEKPFLDTIQFQMPQAAMVAGDFIYLPPILYSNFSESPFKLEERTYPIDFPYPFAEQYILKLKIPETYAVDDMPENVHYYLPDKSAGFQFAAKDKGTGEISVSTKLYVNRLKFRIEEYKAIKSLFDVAAQKYGEQIVLKKK